MPIFNINKPLGLSSHDVVSRTRRLLNTKKVGHAGTLDPLATGVLVILVDESTKLSQFLIGSDKHYLAYVSFGASTPTLDAEGPIEKKNDTSNLKIEDIQTAAQKFLDLKEQAPPNYSAIKKGGVKAYDAARRGESLDLAKRAVEYYEVNLLDFAANRDLLTSSFSKVDNIWQADKNGIKVDLPTSLGNHPTALFHLKVKAGTYIRSFARDLGLELNQEAHLSGLVRTKAASLELDDSIGLEQMPNTTGQSSIKTLPYPIIELDEEETRRIKLGQRLKVDFEGRVGLVHNNELVAIAENINEKMKLLRVWN